MSGEATTAPCQLCRQWVPVGWRGFGYYFLCSRCWAREKAAEDELARRHAGA